VTSTLISHQPIITAATMPTSATVATISETVISRPATVRTMVPGVSATQANPNPNAATTNTKNNTRNMMPFLIR
jgi:hypothetical protein